MKDKLLAQARIDAHIVSRIHGRNITVKFTRKRVLSYKKGRYVGWVKKSALRKFIHHETRNVRGKPGFKKIKLEEIVLQKRVSYRGKHKELKLASYTKSQRRYIMRELKANKFPVKNEQKLNQIQRLTGKFKSIGVRVSRPHDISP